MKKHATAIAIVVVLVLGGLGLCKLGGFVNSIEKGVRGDLSTASSVVGK